MPEGDETIRAGEGPPSEEAGTGEVEDAARSDPELVESEEDLLPFWDGDALDTNEAASITSSARTNVVVLAGSPDSGKTTLIASLFHAFQRGSFAGFLFAGSKTLIGFDRRCHLARTASEGEEADTARTRPGESRTLLHLRLCRESEPGKIRDVLFSDLSGEDYRAAKDSVEQCRRLELVPRADHFVLLIDGHRLSQLDARQSAKNEAVMLLRSCVDAGQLASRSLVDVVFSKWDLVENLGDRDRNMEFAREVRARIEDVVASRLGRLRFLEIAARPEYEGFSLAHGLDVPLPAWIEENSESALPYPRAVYPETTPCEFDRIAHVWDRADSGS